MVGGFGSSDNLVSSSLFFSLLPLVFFPWLGASEEWKRRGE
jgi:hypothetical protein